ncbi:MAG: hypothetical protein A2138_10035 [Deltaproteobacteria bacterium RBG_16_71_12]|nr:MAG: hypothetical protein A2138_10035 [Deltaproteobacteria bacterium RBG_16_71_12]
MRLSFNRLLLAVMALALAGLVVVLMLRQDTNVRGADGRPVGLAQMAPEELDLHADRDALRFKRIVGQTIRLHQRLAESAALFDRPGDRGLSADERRQALDLFEAVLDHTIALDQLSRVHLDFLQISVLHDPLRHARHFALYFAAYTEKLALGLALIDRTINKPQFEKLFDEGNQGLGIVPGAYGRLKWNVVHVEDAATALAAHQWMKLLGAKLDELARGDAPRWGFLITRLEDRYQTVMENLSRKSVKLFGGNTFDIGKDTAHAVWFPVQTELAEVMGDTKVKRLHQYLISAEQVGDAAKRSAPGDVLVERRNWYVSNVGLPGFWPHAALWLGSAEELAAYFADPEVERAFGGSFPRYLEDKFPLAWTSYSSPDAEGHTVRLIEAISEGVVFTSAEHSIGTADYVAAMRPELKKLDKARAIARAFLYAGRPYDFDFDFYTDATLVCSELVYKAYEPRQESRGLALPLEKVVGRMTLGPNTMVRLFDEQLGGKQQQLSFAWFLDGHERERRASFEPVEVFRRSWTRPKWDVAQR